MKVKELKQILEQFNEELHVGVAVETNCSDCENDIEVHIENLCFDGVWYNPHTKQIYIGGNGNCN